MKPRLVKFSCPACNARLAVPGSMAGMEDNCPKCSARIRAPALEPGPAAAPPADPPPPSAEPVPHKSDHDLLDAVLNAPEPDAKAAQAPAPGESDGGSKKRETFRSTLFDEFLSTPLHPVGEPAPAAPEGSPKIRVKAAKAAKPASGSNLEGFLPAPPTSLPAARTAPAGATTASPTLLEIISASGPNVVTPPPEPDLVSPPSAPTGVPEPDEDDAGFGMGDMLAEKSVSSALPVTRHVLPSLGVGLMQVEDTPRRHRLLRRRRAILSGILLFLLFDAVIAGWIFHHRISEWWNERHPVVVAQPAASKPPPALPAPARVPAASSATDVVQPPLRYGANAAPASPGAVPGPSPVKSPPAPPADDPGIPAPALNSGALLPASDLIPPGSVFASLPAALGSQPALSPRGPDDLLEKNSVPAARVMPLVPLTPAIPEVPVPVASKPSEPPATAPGDGLMAKTEIPPPPLPPPLPPGAAIPEAPIKPAASESSPGLSRNPDNSVSSVPTIIVEKGVTMAARPALVVLKSFLAAPTWQERLRLVQKPDAVRSAMEKHYQKHPDGPVNVEHIEFIERYPARNGNLPYSMFEVRGGMLKHSVLVLVEEKNSGELRVDWEAFVEFKDQLLWEFLIKPGAPPGKFRVMIRRKHYFDKDVPDLDRKDTFEISQPGADTTANVFAVKGASALKSFTRQINWGDSVAVMVELAWHTKGDRNWVELKAVPAFGWRG